MKPLCSAKSYNPFHRADVIEAPSAALKGQDDNSPGQARHERRPGKTATKTQSPFFLFCPESIRGKTGKREVFIFGFVTPGDAALARGYYHIIPTGFRFGSPRSQIGEQKGVKPEVGIGAVHFILDARFAAYAASAQGDEPALNVKPGNQPPV